MAADYEKICDRVLGASDKIRYVGIYDYGQVHDRMRRGLARYLTKEETEISLSQAVYRWSARKKAAEKIGMPAYAFTKYEKIFRITVPMGGAGLMLVSTEPDADIDGIVEDILRISRDSGLAK